MRLGGGRYWSSGGGLVTKLRPTLVITWTVALQTPLSMGFPKQEFRSGLSFPSPGDLPDSEIEPLTLQVISCIPGRFFTD